MQVENASHYPIKTESEGTPSVIQSDEIYSDYFGLIVSIPLPDCRAKSPPPPYRPTESDMSDYRRSPPIIITPPPSMQVHPLARFHIRFSTRSFGQKDAIFIALSVCPSCIPVHQSAFFCEHDMFVPI